MDAGRQESLLVVGQSPDARPTLNELTKIEIKPQIAGSGGFARRGISPDGRTLYFNAHEGLKEPKRSVRSTLVAVDTQTGKQTPVARVTNVNNENPDWDWHDDSGINPAHAAAAKTETALPVVRAGNKDVDPEMGKIATPAER